MSYTKKSSLQQPQQQRSSSAHQQINKTASRQTEKNTRRAPRRPVLDSKTTTTKKWEEPIEESKNVPCTVKHARARAHTIRKKCVQLTATIKCVTVKRAVFVFARCSGSLHRHVDRNSAYHDCRRLLLGITCAYAASTVENWIAPPRRSSKFFFYVKTIFFCLRKFALRAKRSFVRVRACYVSRGFEI